MTSRQTYYEIFTRRNPKSEWALVETHKDREQALSEAQSLHERRLAGSVRVDKATYDPGAGAFQTVTILGLGDAESGMHARAGKTEEPPCSAPEDLATIHARRIIAQVLREWLEREMATPMELLHRPDLAAKLERADTTLQHAIQKTARAQAAEYEANVQHFVKRLTELASKAIASLIEKDKKGRLVRMGLDGFGALADRLGADRVYAMRTAVASALEGAESWAEKTQILLSLADDLDGRETREAALSVIDDFLSEVIAAPRGADALVPDAACVGDRLEVFVAIIGGDASGVTGESARALARRFAAREMAHARGAVIRRVLAELLTPQRLKPGEFWNELHQTRRLADAMTAMAGPDLPPEDVGHAFFYRSGRLVQPEAIEEALAGAKDVHEEVEHLIRLEQALAGPLAKKKLATYLRAHLGSHRIEAELAHGEGNPLERAQRIAALQQTILSSQMPDEDRTELAAVLDRMCMTVLGEAHTFDAFAKGAGAPLDRAAALLKLAARGGITKGRASAEASSLAQMLVRQAVRDGAAAPDKLTEIRALMDDLAA